MKQRFSDRVNRHIDHFWPRTKLNFLEEFTAKILFEMFVMLMDKYVSHIVDDKKLTSQKYVKT